MTWEFLYGSIQAAFTGAGIFLTTIVLLEWFGTNRD